MTDSEQGLSSSNPADSDSDQSSGIRYTCRKCPDEVFTAKTKEQHRLFHRKERQQQGKNKPGPRSKKQTNQQALPSAPGSVDSTATTLFNVRDDERYPKRDRNPKKSKTTEESISPKSRKRRSVELHVYGAKKTKGKYQGN